MKVKSYTLCVREKKREDGGDGGGRGRKVVCVWGKTISLGLQRQLKMKEVIVHSTTMSSMVLCLISLFLCFKPRRVGH